MCFANQYLAEEMGYRKNYWAAGIELIPVAQLGVRLGNTLGAAVYAHVATPHESGCVPSFAIQILMADLIHFVRGFPFVHKQAAVEMTLVLSFHRVKAT